MFFFSTLKNVNCENLLQSHWNENPVWPVPTKQQLLKYSWLCWCVKERGVLLRICCVLWCHTFPWPYLCPSFDGEATVLDQSWTKVVVPTGISSTNQIDLFGILFKIIVNYINTLILYLIMNFLCLKWMN